MWFVKKKLVPIWWHSVCVSFISLGFRSIDVWLKLISVYHMIHDVMSLRYLENLRGHLVIPMKSLQMLYEINIKWCTILTAKYYKNQMRNTETALIRASKTFQRQKKNKRRKKHDPYESKIRIQYTHVIKQNDAVSRYHRSHVSRSRPLSTRGYVYMNAGSHVSVNSC